MSLLEDIVKEAREKNEKKIYAVNKQKKLKAKKKKSRYKNTDAYIDAVWRNNKDMLNERLNETNVGMASNKSLFKKKVKEYMKQGMTVDQAIEKVRKSRIVRSREEQWLERKDVNFNDRVLKGKNYKEIKKNLHLKNKKDLEKTVVNYLGYGSKSHYGKVCNFQVWKLTFNGKNTYVVVWLSPKSGEQVDYEIYNNKEFEYLLEPYLN